MFDTTNKHKAEALLFKRQEFSHEKEVRLIYYETKYSKSGRHKDIKGFKVDPNES